MAKTGFNARQTKAGGTEARRAGDGVAMTKRERKTQLKNEEETGTTTDSGVIEMDVQEKLWNAIIDGNEGDAVSLLARFPALSIACRDDLGRTPLHASVFHGPARTGILDAIEGAGLASSSSLPLNVDAPDAEGLTPLHIAVAREDAMAVTWLLARGADPLNRSFGIGTAPMEIAAATSKPNVLGYMVTHLKADQDQRARLRAALPNLLVMSADARTCALESTKLLLSEFASGDRDGTEREPLLLGHIAAAAGNSELLSWLLSPGAVGDSGAARLAAFAVDPLSLDAKGWTLMHCAAASGSVECCASVLNKNPALIGATGSRAIKPLHLAAMACAEPCVELLLARGADATECDEEGRRAAHYAAIMKDVVILRMLLIAEYEDDGSGAGGPGGAAPKAIGVQDASNMTPLHYAARGDFAAGVVELLSEPDEAHLAAIKLRNRDGDTPLMIAAAHGSAASLAELLKHATPSDVLCLNARGMHAVHLACMRASPDALELLLWFLQSEEEEEDGRSTEDAAGGAGDVTARQIPLEVILASTTAAQFDGDAGHERRTGPSPSRSNVDATRNARSIGRSTCLHLASTSNGSAACLAMLLEVMERQGLHRFLDAEDEDGMSALHVAARCGSDVAAALILDADAARRSREDVNNGELRSEGDNNDREAAMPSPLHLACQHGHVRVAKVLLDARAASVHDTLEDGSIPLHGAAAMGAVHCVMLLCEYGSPIDGVNERGMSALMVAARRGHTMVVATLLRLGAASTKRDKGGRTAAMHAAAAGHGEVSMMIDSHLYRKRLLKRVAGAAPAQPVGTHADADGAIKPAVMDINAAAYVNGLSKAKMKTAYDARLLKPFRTYLKKKTEAEATVKSDPFK